MSSTTVKKTITTALWDYTTPEGSRRIAYRGEVVELSPEEAERGEKAGVFNQPAAGVVVTPNLPHDVLADNFAGVYEVIEPRAFVPPEDDVVAPLRHDIQPAAPAVDEAEAADPTPDGSPPARDANKPDVVEWVAANLSKEDGSDFTKSELNRMNKDELWDLIDGAES